MCQIEDAVNNESDIIVPEHIDFKGEDNIWFSGQEHCAGQN